MGLPRCRRRRVYAAGVLGSRLSAPVHLWRSRGGLCEVEDSQARVPSEREPHQIRSAVAAQRRGDVDEIPRFPPCDQSSRLRADRVLDVEDRADVELNRGPLAPVSGRGRRASSRRRARPRGGRTRPVGLPAGGSRPPRSRRRGGRLARRRPPHPAPGSGLNRSTSSVDRSTIPWATSAFPPASAKPCSAAASAMRATSAWNGSRATYGGGTPASTRRAARIGWHASHFARTGRGRLSRGQLSISASRFNQAAKSSSFHASRITTA